MFILYNSGGISIGATRVWEAETNSAFLGDWASTLSNSANRDNRFESICSDICGTLETSSPISIDMSLALQNLHKICPSTKTLLPSLDKLPEIPQKLQSKLHSVIKNKQFETFLQNSSCKQEKARVISCGGPVAGVWLDAIPSSQHYTMSSAQCRTAILMRLGVPLPQLSNIPRCTSSCNHEVDGEGYHFLPCKLGGGPIFGHDHILDEFYQMLCAVDLRCRKELTSQFADKKRPDIAIYNYRDDKKLLLDITITHPCAVRNLSRSSNKAAFAASEQENRKRTKYSKQAGDLGHLFRPIAMEGFGRWGQDAESTLSEASHMAHMCLQINSAQFKNLWHRRISTSLQKEIVRIIENKVNTIISKKQKEPNAISRLGFISRCFSLDFS